MNALALALILAASPTLAPKEEPTPLALRAPVEIFAGGLTTAGVWFAGGMIGLGICQACLLPVAVLTFVTQIFLVPGAVTSMGDWLGGEGAYGPALKGSAIGAVASLVLGAVAIYVSMAAAMPPDILAFAAILAGGPVTGSVIGYELGSVPRVAEKTRRFSEFQPAPNFPVIHFSF